MDGPTGVASVGAAAGARASYKNDLDDDTAASCAGPTSIAAALTGAAGVGQPKWSESYACCTIAVLRVANFIAKGGMSPYDEMCFLHAIKDAYDGVTARYGKLIWRMHTFQFPYYGVCVPDALGVTHAEVALHTVLQLQAAFSQVSRGEGCCSAALVKAAVAHYLSAALPPQLAHHFES